jgi:hypothetical protein
VVFDLFYRGGSVGYEVNLRRAWPSGDLCVSESKSLGYYRVTGTFWKLQECNILVKNLLVALDISLFGNGRENCGRQSFISSYIDKKS